MPSGRPCLDRPLSAGVLADGSVVIREIQLTLIWLCYIHQWQTASSSLSPGLTSFGWLPFFCLHVDFLFSCAKNIYVGFFFSVSKLVWSFSPSLSLEQVLTPGTTRLQRNTSPCFSFDEHWLDQIYVCFFSPDLNKMVWHVLPSDECFDILEDVCIYVRAKSYYFLHYVRSTCEVTVSSKFN